jgi:hypothetical protein
VDDAADPVGVVVLDHDQAGVAGGHAALEGILDGLARVYRHDGRDRRHHLTRLLLVQMEDARQMAGLLRIQATSGRRLADDGLDVLLGVLLLEPLRADTEQPDDRVGELGQGDRERSAHRVKDGQRPGEMAQRPLGPRDGQHLWNLLADRDVDRGDERVRDGDGDRDGGSVGEAAENRLQQARQ